jgi:RHS repeat-associated protein
MVGSVATGFSVPIGAAHALASVPQRVAADHAIPARRLFVVATFTRRRGAAKTAAVRTGAAAQLMSTPVPPFNECPAVGSDTSCGVLIEVTDTGVNVFSDSNQHAFDGSDDTLVGVINDSSQGLSGLTITANAGAVPFRFEGDGLCAVSPHPAGCPFGTTGYEGPGMSFTKNSDSSGVVNIGLASRGTGYFSLEDALTSTSISSTGTGQLPPAGPVIGPSENQVCNASQAAGAAASVGGVCTRFPVVTPWGNFTHTFSDFSFPGRGPTLGFSRTYNSYPNAAVPDGPLGFGWSNPYAMSLSVTGVSGSQVATITQEDGAQTAFYQSNGGWAPAPRTIATLTFDSVANTFTFTRQARSIYTFDAASGHLNTIADLNGNTESLTYSAGRLSTVTDPEGRTLSFVYYGSGKIAWITDFTGRSVVFVYDSPCGTGNLCTAYEPDGGAWTFTYDASHRMLTMLDPNQQPAPTPHPITNHYDTQGRVDWQQDQLGAGHRTLIAYSLDASNQNGTVTITDPNGNATRELYQNGFKTTVTTGYNNPAQAATWTYAYDPNTLLPTTLVDPNINTTTKSYDAQGNVLKTTDPLNRTTTSTYNNLNEPVTVTDPTGYTTTSGYDPCTPATATCSVHGNLTSTSRPCVDTGTSCGTQVVTYHHDDPYFPVDVTSITDPDGKTWTKGYDGDGNLTSATDPMGNTTTYSYDRLGRRIATYQPTGNDSAVRYDAMNRPRQTFDQLGMPYVDSFSRSNNTTTLGSPESASPSSQVWSYLNGQWGVTNGRAYPTSAGANLAYLQVLSDPSHTTANGTVAATETTGQTDLGVAFHVQDHLNYWTVRANTATTAWDLYKTINGTASKIASTPTALCCSNRRVSVTFTSTGSINVYIDGTLQLQRTDTALDTQAGVGLFGNATGSGRLDDFVAYATANNLGYIYGYGGDAGTAVVTNGYDPNGNLTTTTDPNGNTISRTYDLAGQLSEVDQTNPTTVIASYSYDADGNQTQQTDGNNHTTTYAFTDPAYPRLATSVTMPAVGAQAGKQTQNAYDPAGLLQTVTDPSNRTTTYSYDAANQLLSVTYSDGVTPNVSGITYDADGRRTFYQLGSNLYTYFLWDSLGRMVLSQEGSQAVDYFYDLAGNMTGMGYAFPNGCCGPDDIRIFDAAGRLTAVEDSTQLQHWTYFAYDANSNLTSIAYPNGVTSTNSYDAANRVSSIAHNNPSGNLASFFYGRTAAGQVVNELPIGVAETPQHFAFDPRNRLSADASGTYTYDNADNLTGLSTGTRQAYNEANQLCWTATTTASCTAPPNGATTYSYDSQGNRTQRVIPGTGGSTTNYTYDQANRLTSLPGSYTSYHYDADNLRTQKSTIFGTVNYSWDQADPTPLLLQENFGNTTTSFIYGPDGQPIEQLTGTTAVYLQQDQLGSTRLITNQAGSVTGTYSYNPYGQVPTGWHTGSATTKLQYAGQYYDGESGLTYLHNRYYDPATSQFMGRDAVNVSPQSAYRYASDDPLDGTDPSGLNTVGICAGGNGQLGPISVVADACLTRTVQSPHHQIGIVSTAGGGGGAGADISAGIFYQVSNASSLSQLSGPFYFATVGAQYGGGASVTVFWNSDFTTYGIELGVSVGAGVDVAGGVTDTRVRQLHGWQAFVARGVWDVLAPEFSVPELLQTAFSDIPALGSGC